MLFFLHSVSALSLGDSALKLNRNRDQIGIEPALWSLKSDGRDWGLQKHGSSPLQHPLRQFHSGCEDSIVVFGCCFPRNLRCAWPCCSTGACMGPCSLPLCTSEVVKVCQSSRGSSLWEDEYSCVKGNCRWYLGAHQVRWKPTSSLLQSQIPELSSSHTLWVGSWAGIRGTAVRGGGDAALQ